MTLSRRKATLFRNAVKLHVMTTAEVLLMVEPSKEHRIVWGSPRLIVEYEKGNLRPIVDQEFFKADEIEGTGGDNMVTVEPLSNTPDQINHTMSPTLACVLGHSPNANRRLARRTRIPFENIPVPVREVLVNKPRARINDNEKGPIITEQTEITFVSEEFLATNTSVTSNVENLQ